MAAKIGVVGLGVMGGNLARNMERHGFPVAGYDLDANKTRAFTNGPAKGKNIVGVDSPAALMKALEKPRRILIMVPAGAPVDSVIDHLKPHLESGDILMDGGNSFFLDTERRNKALEAEGFRFIGAGASGGEEGALWGPAIMPGGQREAWEEVSPILRAMAARAEDNEPCVEYMGPRGAGHYVKMVHNGIEYGDMQMICEAYALMKGLLGLKPAEMSAIFAEWNKGILDSFLIEITTEILRQKDPVTKKPFVDVVLDSAGQKGTGKWTSTNALDMGVPAPTIAEAVFARLVSAIKEERVAASKILKGPSRKYHGPKKPLLDAIQDALYCSKICSYAQGFQLMRSGAKEYGWKLKFGEIAQIWRGGCIIRAAFLQKITQAYARNPGLANLLLDPYFNRTFRKAQANWRRVIALAAECGVPAPTFSASLAYYDGYRSARLPANLLQAQRDFFGAHTYERVDRPRGKFFHLDWPDPKRPQVEV